jgi:hypothetical protein
MLLLLLAGFEFLSHNTPLLPTKRYRQTRKQQVPATLAGI